MCFEKLKRNGPNRIGRARQGQVARSAGPRSEPGQPPRAGKCRKGILPPVTREWFVGMHRDAPVIKFVQTSPDLARRHQIVGSGPATIHLPPACVRCGGRHQPSTAASDDIHVFVSSFRPVIVWSLALPVAAGYER